MHPPTYVVTGQLNALEKRHRLYECTLLATVSLNIAEETNAVILT